MQERRIEDLPEETQSIVERLVSQGCIDVVNQKVNISDEMAEVLLILDRADIFD